MFDANTRIKYNKDTKTGQVYKKVNGDWRLDEVRTDWGGKAASTKTVTPKCRPFPTPIVTANFPFKN